MEVSFLLYLSYMMEVEIINDSVNQYNDIMFLYDAGT